MKARAFCPGHISCIFAPELAEDPLESGSRGLGIVLGDGSTAEVSERLDDRIVISVNGVETEAPVTRCAASIIGGGRGFDISIENRFPEGQGFATSASGTLAASMCIASIIGRDDGSALAAAHAAEVINNCGLGDVCGIIPGTAVTLRTRAGLPPFGEVKGIDVALDTISIRILGPGIDTSSVLQSDRMRAITESGNRNLAYFVESPSLESLFEASNRFSVESGMLTPGLCAE